MWKKLSESVSPYSQFKHHGDETFGYSFFSLVKNYCEKILEGGVGGCCGGF
jgi:hypothetical protein